MMRRVMMIDVFMRKRVDNIKYNGDESEDDLCAWIRVVHLRRRFPLICELFEYVYTCVPCRFYFYAFI